MRLLDGVIIYMQPRWRRSRRRVTTEAARRYR